jgi:hypothetical protein
MSQRTRTVKRKLYPWVLAVALIGVIGSTLAITSFAATPSTSVQISSASTANGASIVTNSHAIGGKMLVFNAKKAVAPVPPSTPQPIAQSTASESSPTAPASGNPTATSPGSTQATSPSSSSSPGSSSSTGSSTSSPSAETYSCITTYVPNGGSECPSDAGYTDHPTITGIGNIDVNGNAPVLNQDVWSGDPNYQSTLYANSPSDWKVVVNDNETPSGVLAYPNVGWFPSPAETPVDDYTSITSSWNVTMPSDGEGTVGWAAYDLWFNGPWGNNPDEVMILVDVAANQYYNCDNVASLTVSGVTWYMCANGSERIWKPGPQWGKYDNQASGSIDILAILKYMEDTSNLEDKLPANSTWFAASFGFEICSTGGVTQTFQVNGFTWNQQQ